MADTSSQESRLEFDLHVAHLTETHKAFIENTAKVAGFLLLALDGSQLRRTRVPFSLPLLTSPLCGSALSAAYLLSWVRPGLPIEFQSRHFAALTSLPVFHSRRTKPECSARNIRCPCCWKRCLGSATRRRLADRGAVVLGLFGTFKTSMTSKPSFHAHIHLHQARILGRPVRSVVGIVNEI